MKINMKVVGFCLSALFAFAFTLAVWGTIHTGVDTTEQVTVIHRETIIQTFQNALLPIEWFSMFGGLVLYWLHVLSNCQRAAGKGNPFLKDFFRDNLTEIPMSVISCLFLGLNVNNIPPSIATLHGTLSMLIIGAGGGTTLNAIITFIKPSIVKTATKES